MVCVPVVRSIVPALSRLALGLSCLLFSLLGSAHLDEKFLLSDAYAVSGSRCLRPSSDWLCCLCCGRGGGRAVEVPLKCCCNRGAPLLLVSTSVHAEGWFRALQRGHGEEIALLQQLALVGCSHCVSSRCLFTEKLHVFLKARVSIRPLDRVSRVGCDDATRVRDI